MGFWKKVRDHLKKLVEPIFNEIETTLNAKASVSFKRKRKRKKK